MDGDGMAPTPQLLLKKAALIALGVMGVLLVGSIIFYRQRIFSDSAYILFNIINSDRLQIQENRYGSFISQSVPLLLARLHLPMKAIVIGYSASFNLFYFCTALILYRFREFGLTILLAFYYMLFFSDAYFWPNCELHQGVCWMFLAFGVLRYLHTKAGQQNKPSYIILAVVIFPVLSWLAIFSHPTVIVPFSFLWIFFWIVRDSAPFNKKYSIAYFLVIITISISKYLLSTKSAYDSSNFKGLEHISFAGVLQTFTSRLADHFWQSVLHNYWLLPLILIASVIQLIRVRKYLLLATVLLANLGFFILLCLTFFELNITFHYESEFMPFGILCSAAFVWYVLPSLKKSGLRLAIISGIFLVRLTYIGLAAPKYFARTQIFTHALAYMKENGIKKAIVTCGTGQQLDDAMLLHWALAYEGVIYSKVNGDTVGATLISRTDEQLSKNSPMPHPTTDFYSPWGYIPAKDLQQRYLSIDTVQPYIIVPAKTIMGLN